MTNEKIMKAYTSKQRQQFEKWWQQTSKKIEISEVAGPVRYGPPRLEDNPRFPVAMWPVSKEDLAKNLEMLVKLSLDLGAVDAKAIPTKDIPQDIRSLYVGCLYPTCRWLNTNFNCPMERTFPLYEMENLVKGSFDYALVFKVLPPVFDTTPDVGRVDLNRYYNRGRSGATRPGNAGPKYYSFKNPA